MEELTSLLIFVVWVFSLVMIVISFHWVWLAIVALIAIYYMIKFAVFIDFDFLL